ncbi:MAG TPA: hypothetical protein VFV23_11480 [Verrucomicrobiae bacterium]|nr:hypothetical protein [Verrucomicrobiae bacterium]
MLSDPSRWCVVTHHKENYSLLPAFMAYYRQYFGFKRAMIFCGMTRGRTHDSLKQLLAEKLNMPIPVMDKTCFTPAGMELKVCELTDGDFVLWVASYPATEYTPGGKFHHLRSDVHAWGASYLPPEIMRTMVVDSDEFLYVKDFKSLDMDQLGFHFIDVIPSEIWPPKTLKFSLQGWYYTRQARPHFKYGGRIAESLARLTGRGLQHNQCKTYWFCKNRMASFTAWTHGTAHSLSGCGGLNVFLDDLEKCHRILRETSCCYHLAMTTKNHLFNERMRLQPRLQTDYWSDQRDGVRGKETMDLNAAEKTFNRSIRKSIFPVIEDNFLLPYLSA